MNGTTLTVTIQGVAPLLLHNGHLADPLNPLAKELKKLTGKRTKTEEDHMAIRRMEWEAGLYIHDDRVVIPGENIERALWEGAKKHKAGPKVKAGLFCAGFWPLRFPHRDTAKIEELWDLGYWNTSSARVQQNRVMRTRPCFAKWALTFELTMMPGQLDQPDVELYVTTAGAQCGLGDWRPKHGRFVMTSLVAAGGERPASADQLQGLTAHWAT